MQKILVVLGPTAVGKSDLAVELALLFNGEIISADSRQVYRRLDIGTGKITHEEMRGVPHYLLDVANPTKQYSVAQWKKEAEECVGDILDRGKFPIICGGTGLYIQSLVENSAFPEVPPNNELREKLAEKSTAQLFELLKSKDALRAETIDKNNPRRLIRAIEIVDALGSVPLVAPQARYNALQIGLTLDRDILKERIIARLNKRLKQGMIEEAEELHRSGLSYKRMNELGLEYRYLAKYLQKKKSFDEMKIKLGTEIFRYAKRQETWFKRDKTIQWFRPEEKEAIVETVRTFVENS